MDSHVAGAGVRHIASRLFTSFPCTMVIVSARPYPHPSHRLITGISKLKQHSEGKEAAAAMAMDDHPTVDGQQRRDETQLGEINEPHLGLIKMAPRPWEDSLSLPEWL
ncbi:hypothetical protein AOLI_G00066520 [Acnodon oligacanthus]